MKRLLFSIAFLFLAFCSQAQFRLAVNGTPSWTSLGGGLYQATVTFHADLTGNSYAVAGIVDTMRLFTGRGQVFEVDSVWGKTFSQATLRVEYFEGVSSAPVGQSMVYNPNGSVFIPDVPFGSTGATAQLNQAVVTYNASKAGTSSPPFDSTDISAGGLGVTDASAALITHIRQPGVDSTTAHRTDITNLQTLIGRPDGATNLGTMSQGTQYPDSLDVKVFADSTDAKITRLVATTALGFTGFQSQGDSIFQWSRTIKTSRYNALRNEFGGISYNPYTGRIVKVNRYGTGHSYNTDDYSISQYSDDLGATWSDTTRITTSYYPLSAARVADPCISWDEVGRRHLGKVQIRDSYTATDTDWTTVIISSTDGITWDSIGQFARPGTAQCVMFVTEAPVRLADSTIVITGYTSEEGCDVTDTWSLWIFKSTDDGVTWDTGVRIDTGDIAGGSRINEAQTMQLKNGNIEVYARGRYDPFVGNESVLKYVSSDGGVTWVKPPVEATPPSWAPTKPSRHIFGRDEDYTLQVYRSTEVGDGSTGLWAYSPTGLYGTWSEARKLPQASAPDGYFLYGEFERINDYTALFHYCQADTSSLTLGTSDSYFNIVTFTPPIIPDATDARGITGDGTADYYAKFSGDSTQVDSRMSDISASRTKLTIPSSTPFAGFEITATDGGFEFENGTGSAGAFSPIMQMNAKGGRANRITATDDTSTSSFGMFEVNGIAASGDVSGTRNLFKVMNNSKNRFIINNGGEVSIHSVSSQPTAWLDIADTTGTKAHLRLSFRETAVWGANAKYVELKTDASGNLLILPVTGNVGINTSSPAVSSLLDLTSTTRGFLPPRMTITQRNAISSPATGLMVYTTTLNKLNYYNGSAWLALVDSVTALGWNHSATQDIDMNSFDLTEVDSLISTDTIIVSAPKVILNATSGTDIKRSGGGRIAGFHGSDTDGYIGLLTTSAGSLRTSLGYGTGILTGSLSNATSLRSENSLHFGAGGDNLSVTLLSSGNLGLGTTAPTNTLSLGGEANRIIWMERRTAAASNGNNLTIQAGGATSGGTNKTGGNLVFYAGTATGTGGGAGAGSNISFATSTPGASGTSDATVTTKVIIQNDGNVGVGTTSPVLTALLEMQDTAKGFLKPRLTTTQRDAIASPATGLEIYNTTTNAPNFYNGSAWTALSSTVSGTGSTNKLTIWNGASALGFESNLSVDTTNSRLEFNEGTDKFSMSTASDKLTVWNDAGTPIERMTLDSIGNLKAVASVQAKNTAGTSTAQAEFQAYEDADNGDNLVTIKAPASLSADYVQTLTAADGEVPVVLKGSDTLDFPSTNASECSELTITVTGAADGDVVALGIPNSIAVTGAIYTAWVSASNTVTVQYCNTSLLGAGNPGSATVKVQVMK